MIEITSRNNKIICERAKLKDKKFRDSTKLFVFEGRKLFLEAVENGIEIKKIFVTDQGLSLIENPNFCGKRASYHAFRELSAEEKNEWIKRDPAPKSIFSLAEVDDSLFEGDVTF